MINIKSQIREDLVGVAHKLGIEVASIEVERSKDQKFGDYSTNLALQSSKTGLLKVWQSTQEIAKDIVDNFPKQTYIKKIEIAGPGFVNFFLAASFLQGGVKEITTKKEDFAKSDLNKGKKARVEFVSANPTGPLHIGNARGGPLGDVIANVLESVGYDVFREYIHDDVGSQVKKFGESIFAEIRKSKEEREYKGPYISEIAKKAGKVKSSSEAAQKGVELMLQEITRDCEDMGIKFDKVYPEGQFVSAGKTKAVIGELKRRNVLREKDGALWFAPSDEFLGDRECVLVRSDGTYTYFANDIAYHREKFESGADLVIDVFGSGHHGHVPRLKAAIAALDYDPSKLKVILYQMVRVKKGREVIKMSKRAGNYVTAQEVLGAVGRDAFRFFLLMHDPNTHIDFDLALAKKKSSDNPVYYVQYAHARISAILKKAGQVEKNADLSLLTHEQELRLIKKLIELPELIEDISRNFQVHALTTYSVSLADHFHKFYEEVRVISDDKKSTYARLQLVWATGIILRTVLGLLGVSAPKKM